jgi:hypothetical protein
MPDNDRRRALEKEIEDAIKSAVNLDMNTSMIKEEGSRRGHFPTSNRALADALFACEDVGFVENLRAFQK